MNSIVVGQKYGAMIGANNDWVTYSKGNDGEENYYRDVVLDGVIVYCDGESVEVVGYDEEKKTVTLYNDGLEGDGNFTIPLEQFSEDFMLIPYREVL